MLNHPECKLVIFKSFNMKKSIINTKKKSIVNFTIGLDIVLLNYYTYDIYTPMWMPRKKLSLRIYHQVGGLMPRDEGQQD